jgi:hypothetical protein
MVFTLRKEDAMTGPAILLMVTLCGQPAGQTPPLVPVEELIHAVSPDGRNIVVYVSEEGMRGRFDVSPVESDSILYSESLQSENVLSEWLDDSTLFVGSAEVPYHTVNILTGDTTVIAKLGGIPADMACIDRERRRLYLVASDDHDEAPPYTTDVWVYDFDSKALEHLALTVYMGFGYELEVLGRDTLLFTGINRLNVISIREDKAEDILDDQAAPLETSESSTGLFDGGRKLLFCDHGKQLATFDFDTRKVTRINGFEGYWIGYLAPNGKVLFVMDYLHEPYPTYRIDNPTFLFPDSGAIEEKK